MNRLATAILLATLAFLTGGTSIYAQDAPVADGSMVDWPTFNAALDAAAKSERIVLIDIYSPSCGWCRKLQTEIYTRTELQTYIYDTFELGQLDITVASDTVQFRGYAMSSAELGAGFGATGTPTTIFLESDGEYITRLPGFHKFDEFLDVLKFVGSRAFRDMSYTEYLDAQEK